MYVCKVKNLLTICLLFALPALAFAQAKTPAVSKDKNAEALLNTISNRYKKFKTMKADFTYIVENKAEKSQEKQKGTIFVKGNKFKLDVAGQLIICDNQTVWTYSKEVNEVQINNYNPKQATIRLDDIFTMYDKGFIYKMDEEKKENGKDIAIVELTPKDKKKAFFKIKLTIDKTNQTITKSVVYDKSGTIHTYVINNQVPNLKLEDGFFRFDVKSYPKAEVIDLRN